MKTRTRSRVYLWTEDGPWRLPKTFFDLNKDRAHAFPQYADTQQKTVQVIYEWHGNRLYTQARGDFLYLDANGQWEMSRSAQAAIEHSQAYDDEQRALRCKPVHLNWVRRARGRKAKHRWELTADDRRRITFDLLPVGDPDRRPIPMLRPGRDKSLERHLRR